MNNTETVETLLLLLRLPDGQGWVSIQDLKDMAEKLDGGKK
jgi:hypothetical protein